MLEHRRVADRVVVVNITEANQVNVLVRAVYQIDRPYADTGNGPDERAVRLAAHDLIVRAYKVLRAGVHPADIQKAERRHHLK